MSKTYRRSAIDLDMNDQSYPYNKSWWDEEPEFRFASRTGRMDYYSRRNKKHDSKPFGKSPGWYKKMKARARRAKVCNAMAIADYDNIPHFRNTNDWEWT